MSKITHIATGDANFYQLMRNAKWLAVVQFNGELTVAAQESMLDSMVATGEDVIQLHAEIDRLQDDAERFAIMRAVLVNDDFAESLNSLATEMPEVEPIDAEHVNAQFDLYIKVAKDNGLWPIKVSQEIRP